MKEAIEKLKAEMGKEKNPYVQVVGQFLQQHLEQNPQNAEKILNPDKTIMKSLDEMRKVAEKKKVGNAAVLTDAEGFAVVFKYFGIEGDPVAPVSPIPDPAEVPAALPKKLANDFDVKLDDFL